MPEVRLDRIRPGINIEVTASAGRGGWVSSNLVRWRLGFLEKLRGWARVATQSLAGTRSPRAVCRALHWWQDLSGLPWLAAGTNANLYLLQYAAIYDITPSGFVAGPVSSTGIPFSLLVWSLDNFGEQLLAIPSGGPLYVWVPPATGTPATLVTTSPPHNQGGFMTMPQRIFMAFGSAPDGGSQDPLLIRWCAQDDFTTWILTTTNQAGSFRLSRGSRIVGGVQTPLSAFLWTDLDLWGVTYEGFPLVFGFNQLASNCGLIAQKALVVLGSVPYWQSDHGFFRASQSGVEQIPCSVWDFVYLDLDAGHQDKCFAGVDYLFSEIFFFFPSASGHTHEIDSYVKYNAAENLWDAGRALIFIRTAWTDQNRPGAPLTTDLAGFIQQQDVGHDADGAPMAGVSATTGFSDLMDGGALVYVARFIPDFKWEGAAPSIVVGPLTITPQTEYVTIDVTSREWAMEIDTSAADTWFRMGASRFVVAPVGRPIA